MPKQSVLSEAQSAAKLGLERSTYQIKALLAGPPGSGKTTSALTLPGHKLLIDCDNRSHSVIGEENLDIVQILEPNPDTPTAAARMEALAVELWQLARRGELPYDSIILDGLTSLNRFYMNWALVLTGSGGKVLARGLGGAPAREHYSPQMYKLSRLILELIPLPCNFALTCHMRMFEDEEDGTLEYLPIMYGNTRSEIAGWFNETYFCRRVRGKPTKEGKRTTRFQWVTTGGGSKKEEVVKSSLNKKGEFWDDPVIDVDFSQPPVGFERLLDLRFGKEEK